MKLKFTLGQLVVYSCMCYFSNISATSLGDPCVIPEGLAGTCAGLRQCPLLLKLLTSGSTVKASTKQYVRKLLCGPILDRQNPLICCVAPNNEQISTVHPNQHLINTLTCGQGFGSRILGGVVADLAEFPWIALLAYTSGSTGNTTFRCGGSLINDRYVLTAAHCITRDLKSVRLGEHNTQLDEDCTGDGVCAPPVQDIAINKTIVHRRFLKTKTKIANDIALLRLSRPVILNTEYVQPICLPVNTKQNLEGRHLTVAGWGRIDLLRGASSDVLQKVRLPVMANFQCSQLYKALDNITISAQHLCAGGSNHSQDSCNGDSGGPLMTIDAEFYAKYVQYGIVSFGLSRCGTPGYPGVYTRVGSYVKWILDNISA